MAVLGTSTQGATGASTGASRMFCTKYTLASAGTLTELHGWVRQTTVALNIRIVIYKHVSGTSPRPAATLVAYTAPVALGIGSATIHVQQTGFSVPLAAGDYWIGFRSDAAGGLAWATAGGGYSGTDSGAPDPPPDPFGSAGSSGSGTSTLNCWAVYTTASTPVADFTGTPLTGTFPLSVAFTDSSTNTPTAWAWTFGDGGTSTAQNPSHSYTAAGTYTVTLQATNAAGSNTKTRTGYVTVTAPVDAHPPGVSLAFTDPWDEPDPTWTRLDTLTGCRVRGWTVDRGRPNEFAKTGTGTATVRIADLDGLFDPTNATSPYYPNVVPGKQAAISLYNPVSDTWHIRFRGFVEAWRYVLSQTREHMELQLDLVDGFAMLARAELRVGVDGVLPLPAEVAEGNVGYAETTGPVGRDRMQAILGDVGWPYEWRVGDADPDPDIFTGNVRVGPKVYAAGTSALDALWDAADAEFPGVANLYISAGGHVTFHGRQARFRPLVAEYGITLYNVGDIATIAADAAAVPVSELEWAIEDSQIYNACIATPEGVGTGSSWRQLDPAKDDVAGQLVTDEPSRAAYGLQSLTFDNLQTIEDIATGESSLAATKKFATYYVANYKDPHVRISRIVFKSRRPGADHGSPLWAFLNNVDISDLLTVKTAHGGGGGFFREFFVEGLHYTCRPGAPNVPVVELSLDVSPREHWSDGSMFEDDA